MSYHSNTMTTISASDLKINYGSFRALDLNDLKIEGNIIALIGHNGAGKSTFIKALLGLLPIASGQFALSYRDQNSENQLYPELHMAFCPETGAVFSDISVESYIKLWCRIKHADSKYYLKQGAEILERLEITPLLRRLGRELSKGQRRRVQTAIGFLTSPKLFLFDEPFDGLDIQKSHELSEILATQSRNMSMIISSHRMDVVERLADAVIVLQDGKLAAAGSVSKVCQELCPQSIHISNLTSIESMLVLLREQLPEILINRLGEKIALAGSQIDLNSLQNLIDSHDRNGATLSTVNAGLSEAMNYHLRKR